MPQLPDAQDLGQRPVPQPSTAVASYQPGQVAGAISGLGAATEDASKALEQVKQSEIETQVNDQYVNKFAPYAAQQRQQLMLLQSGDAVKADQNGVTPMTKYFQNLQDTRNAMRDQIQGSYGKQLFDQRAGRHIEGELDFAANYVDNQQKVYNLQTYEGMLDNYSNQTADNWNNPEGLQIALNSGKAEIEKHGQQTGQPAAFIAKNQSDWESKALVGSLFRQSDVDPQGALERYKGTPQDILDGKSGLQNQIDASLRPQVEAHLIERANNAEQSQVALSFMNGTPVVSPSGNKFIVDPHASLQSRATSAVQMAAIYADETHPDDPHFKDALITHIKSDFGTMKWQKNMDDNANLGNVAAGLYDQNGAPRSFTDAMANPQWAQQYRALPIAQQGQIRSAFVQNQNILTPTSARLVDTVKGMATADPQGFSNYDVGQLVGKIPQNELESIINLKASMDKNAMKNNVTMAQVNQVQPVMAAAGILGPTGQKTAQYLPFVAKFQEAVSNWQATNKRVPNTADLVAIAKQETQTVEVPGRWFGSNTTPVWKLQGTEKVIVPDNDRQLIVNQFQKRGLKPTDDQIRDAYLRVKGAK